jgi:multiple sugar transport system substrate-binding protein
MQQAPEGNQASTSTRRHVLGVGAGVFGATVAAVGCAPGSGGSAAEKAPPAGTIKAGTKLSFAGWGDPTVQEISNRHAKRFQETHPGVNVEFISTQGLNHLEKITAAQAAGTPIDVFYLSPGDTPTLANRGQLRAIDDLIKRDRYDASDFYEKCIGQYNWKGKLYALPRGFGNQDIYYNVAAFQATGITLPPYDWNARTWTTDEFLDAAIRLTRAAGTDGWGWNQGRGFRQWAPWVWNFGGDVLDKAGTRSVLDQPQAIEGLQFLQDLIHRHRVMPAPDVRLNGMNAFGSGTLGMQMGIPANLANYRRLEGLSWDVAPMPRKATRVTSGGGVAWHMSAATADVNGAWELHKMVAGKEFQTDECQADVTAPPRKSVLRSACFVDRSRPPKGIDVMVQAPEFVQPDPQALGWTEAEEVLNEALGALWNGSKTARQIVQEVSPQVNRILQENAR